MGTILLHQASLFPNLSPEEEAHAFRLWHAASSIAARNRIVLSHLKLVRKMATVLSRRSPCDVDHLFSAGTMGLFRAMESFDGTRGLRFATYAAWWIRHAMQECIDFATSVVRRRIQHRRSTVSASTSKKNEDWVSWGIVSLNKRGVDDEQDEAWLDCLADDRATPEESVLQSDLSHEQHKALSQAWAKLSKMEQDVLTLRYGQGTKWTLDRIAQLLHRTHEGVRQIEKRGLKKLRQELEGWL